MSNLASGSGSEAYEELTAFDAGLFPAGHRPWRQWVADHNPCLLLSTVLMLLGCYLVNSALTDQFSNPKLLALLGVMNIYEACIIPLGLVLIRRARGTARDGMWLILFEMLFVVNATLANPDFGPGWAIPLNAGLWVLACVKVAVVLKGLKIGLGVGTFGFLALMLGIIYALPVIFALTNVHGRVPPTVMYGLWWVVGMLPVVYDIAARAWRDGPWDKVQNVVRRAYVIGPWCMLVVHMGFSHWAHDCDFTGAFAAPVLLGLAVAVRRSQREGGLRMAAWYAPAAALLLTVLWPAEGVEWAVRLGDALPQVNAGHIMLVGTVLTYGYMGTLWHLMAAGGAVVVMGVGYACMGWIGAGVRFGARTAWGIVPTTVLGWGVVAIGLAFVLLGVGGWWSLRSSGKGEAK